MHFKKILLAILLFFGVFLAVGCSPKNYNIDANLYVQDYINGQEKYVNVSRKSFIKEKNVTVDEKLQKEILKDLTKYFTSKHYKYHDTKVKQDKNGYVFDYYLNLVEYDINVKLPEGKTKSFKNKALQPIDFKGQNLDLNGFYFDQNNNKKITNTSIVEANMKIVSIGKGTTKQHIEVIEQVVSLLQNTKIDATLKNPIDYIKDSKYIDVNRYNNLKTKLDEFLKVVNSKDSNVIKTKLSDLESAKTNFTNLIVIGTKELDSIDFFETKVNLFKQTKNDLKTFLNDKLVETNLLQPNNYPLNTKHISFNDFQKLSDLYKKAVVLETTIKYEENNNENNTLLIKQLEELTNEIKSIVSTTNVVVGTKKGKKLTYLVKTTKDNVTTQKQMTGYEGETVTVAIPSDLEDKYQVSPNSKISGILKDENLVLELILATKVLTININLNGGKIENYSKNYLEVPYDSKISDEDILKLNSVTKEKDLYAEKYQFVKYIDANTYEDVNLNNPITKDLNLLAVYTETKDEFNYPIHVYYDIANSETLDDKYGKTPTIKTSTTKATQGNFLVHLENVPEGFEIDEKLSETSFSRFTKEDVVKVYLKRKLHRIKFYFDNKEAYINDKRIVNNIAIVKHGSRFDFAIAGLEAPKDKNKFVIFNEVLNKASNQIFDTTKDVESDLELLITTKQVEKRTKVITNYSYIGEYQKIDNINVYFEKYIYVENGKKINDVDKNFFKSYSYDGEATFDLTNNKGYVLNKENFSEFNVDEVLNTVNEQSEIKLLFVYNMTKEQAKQILLNELYLKEYAKEFYRVVYGKIIDKHEKNLYLLETENQDKFLIHIQKDLTSEESQAFTIGNNIRLTAPVLYNYSKYVSKNHSNDETFAFKISRYGDVVIPFVGKSQVKLVNSDSANNQAENISKLSKENYYKRVNINNLVVTEISKGFQNLENYDDKKAPKYYVIGVKDPFNNNGYLMMQENNTNSKFFSEVHKDDILNIKNSLLISAKANIFENGIEGFYDSALDSKPTLLIDDFTNQVELKNTEKVKVTVNTIFNKYEEFTEFTNLRYDVYVSNTHTVQSTIDKVLENKVFNGYKIKEVKSNNLVVDLNSKVAEGQVIDVEFEKNNSYIEFILVSYIPHELKKLITLEATTGGKKYITYPVDITGNFIKFILDYNGKDHFVQTTLTLGEKAPNSRFAISIAEEERRPQKLRYVAYDGGRYSPVIERKGTAENFKVSYTWAAQHPFLIRENETGFFVDLFDLYKSDGSSSFFAKMHVSEIFLVSDGFKSSDAEFHVNVEHNGLIGYGAFTGHNFYKVDGVHTTEELNQNNDLKMFLKANINYAEERMVDGKLVSFTTNRKIDYFYHKDSLHKLVKIDPKYNIGIIHLNGDNVLVPAEGENPEINVFTLTAKQQKDDRYKLSTSNKLVFNDKKTFLTYLKDKNIDLLDTNAGADKSYVNLAKYNANFKFEIKTPNYTFVDNKTSKEFLLYYLEDKINHDELKINLNGNQEVVYMQEINGKLYPFDMTYDFSNVNLIKNDLVERNVKVNIYIVEKKNIEIRVIPTTTNLEDIKLGYSNNNIYTEQNGVVEKNYKKFNVDIKTFNDENYVNNFTIIDGNKLMDKYNFTLPNNISLKENEVYYYIEKTNQVIKANREDNLIGLFAELNSEVYLNNQKIELSEFNKDVKYLTAKNINNQSYIEFKNNNIIEQKHVLTDFAEGKVNVVTFKLTSKSTINNIIEKNNDVLKVTVKNNINDEVQTLYFDKSNDFNKLYLTFDKLNIKHIDNKEIKLTKRNLQNKYFDFDLSEPISNDINYLDLKVYYFEKYSFGQTVKVYFDYNFKFEYPELDEILYNGYLLVEKNNKIKMPTAQPKLKPEYIDTKLFKGFAVKDGDKDYNLLPLIDFETYTITDASKDIEIVLLDKDNKSNVKFYKRVYFSKLDGSYNEIDDMRKEFIAPAGTVVEFSLNGNPYGYQEIKGTTLNKGKSKLKVTLNPDSNDNDISIYYDVEKVKIELYMGSVKLNNTNLPSGITKKGNRRLFEDYQFDKPFNSTSIYTMLVNKYFDNTLKTYTFTYKDVNGIEKTEKFTYNNLSVGFPQEKMYGEIKIDFNK